MNGNDELSLKDITFLRAIRDINGSPERFASTEQGVTPATVTAITEATTLTEEEVTYRLDHPRLGRSGLVKVYEAGPPGDDSASLNSAELTKAGERAIAEAEAEDGADGQDWEPNEAQSEFDDMQEWEPADVESDGAGDATPASGASPSNTTGSGATAAARTSAEPTAGSRTEAAGRANATPTTAPDASETPDDDRIEALEERIEQLEAESVGNQQATQKDHEQVAELAEEVSALRETTDRLASRLDDALAELDAIRDSEYGALDEKREDQFETAVKSMVAFHQLATEVLDVRVENYEPAAGRADQERVEITRNRIGDALGVGKSGGGGGGGMTLDDLSDDDSDWPDPEEAARGGRVFSGDSDESDDTADDEPETESNAPDSGVYPPIGGDGDDSAREVADGEADDAATEAESNAPESGVYPPIGGDGDEAADEAEDGEASDTDDTESDDPDVPESGVYPPIGGDETAEGEGRNSETTESADGTAESEDGSLPQSIRPDTDASEGEITETAAEEGHVVNPIRSTDDAEESTDSLPLMTDAETVLDVRRAVVDGTDETAWRLSDVDAVTAYATRDAVASATAGATGESVSTSEFDDPYPDDEAYARIVGEAPTGDDDSGGDLPAVPPTDEDPAKVRIADGEGPEAAPTDDDD